MSRRVLPAQWAAELMLQAAHLWVERRETERLLCADSVRQKWYRPAYRVLKLNLPSVFSRVLCIIVPCGFATCSATVEMTEHIASVPTVHVKTAGDARKRQPLMRRSLHMWCC